MNQIINILKSDSFAKTVKSILLADKINNGIASMKLVKVVGPYKLIHLTDTDNSILTDEELESLQEIGMILHKVHNKPFTDREYTIEIVDEKDSGIKINITSSGNFEMNKERTNKFFKGIDYGLIHPLEDIILKDTQLEPYTIKSKIVYCNTYSTLRIRITD